jgi:hypothetical protein
LPPRNPIVDNIESEPEMSQSEYETAVAEFIRSKGITRCPTVCLAPTQGSVAVTDRVALRLRAEQLEMSREEKMRRANASFLPYLDREKAVLS